MNYHFPYSKKKYKEKKINLDIDSTKSIYNKFKDEIEIEKKKFKDLTLAWSEIIYKKLQSGIDTKEKKEKKKDNLDTDV